MIEENNDFFSEALAESGVEEVNEATSEPTTEAEPATPEATPEAEEEAPDATSSETPDAEAETPEKEEAEEEAEPAAKKSGIIDLNPEGIEEVPEGEPTQPSSDPINFNEMFGEGIETAEDVKDRLEYANDLEQQIEALQNAKPTFANEFVEKMDAFTRGGGDPVKFAMFNGIDVDKLSPAEAIKLDLQWTHNMDTAQADAYMNSKYKTEDWDSEDGGIDPKSVYMNVDSTAAKDNLRKVQADNTLVEPAAPTGLSEEQWAARQEEAQLEAKAENDSRMWDEQTGWAPVVSQTVESLQENGITLDLGNGKGFNFAYDKDEAYTTKLINQVDQALYDSGESRESNPDLANAITETIFFAENKGAMFKAYGDEVRSMKDEEYHILNNNPSALKKGAPVPKQNDKPASTEEQMANLWK